MAVGAHSSKRRYPFSSSPPWSDHRFSIGSFSGDLSSLTAPSFILSPTSLTEFPGQTWPLAIYNLIFTSFHFVAYWCERPDLFAAIADAKPGYERSIAVLRWFIVRQHLLYLYYRFSDVSSQGTLKDQYTSRNEETGSEKKCVANGVHPGFLVLTLMLPLDH